MARIEKLKSTEGTPIEDVKAGDDPVKAIKRLYEFGRQYLHGKPHDYEPRGKMPKFKAPQPGWDTERATYSEPTRSSPVTPAPDESGPQFQNDKVATHNDASGSWVRGHSLRLGFDHGASGSRYSRK